MKCPACGFNSFETLERCRKCGADLVEFKARFGLRSPFPHRRGKRSGPGLASGEEAGENCFGQGEPFATDEPAFGEAPWSPADGEGAGSLLFPAAPAARLGALAVDLLALLATLGGFLAVGAIIRTPADTQSSALSWPVLPDLAVPYFLVTFAVTFCYSTLFHFLTGQTPGKMLFGIWVEGEQGEPLTLSQAFLRSVGGLISLLLLGAGFLPALFHPDRRGWNDRLAGTRTVRQGFPRPDGPEEEGL